MQLNEYTSIDSNTTANIRQINYFEVHWKISIHTDRFVIKEKRIIFNIIYIYHECTSL